MFSKYNEDIYDICKVRKRLIKRTKENYYNLSKRNKIHIWDKYFSCRDFLHLRKDQEFTTFFLQFFEKNYHFKEKVWRQSIERHLMTWKSYWRDSEMEKI